MDEELIMKNFETLLALAKEDANSYTDDEWNQRLLDVSTETGLSVETILAQLEHPSTFQEFKKWLEEDAERDYWETNQEV